ncbi:MAG: hypothetical protein H8D23_17600 [Candidatus Brocadiales bacterium]|nr:hypothetical protein [Candidatus Brocadiales bacterium]
MLTAMLNKYVHGTQPLQVRILDFAGAVTTYVETTARPVLKLALDGTSPETVAFAKDVRTKALWEAMDPLIQTTSLTVPIFKGVMEFKPVKDIGSHGFETINAMSKTMVAVSNFSLEIMGHDETGNVDMVEQFAAFYAVGTMLVAQLAPLEDKFNSGTNDILQSILNKLGDMDGQGLGDLLGDMGETHDCDNCDISGGECDIEDEIREKQALGELPKPGEPGLKSIDDIMKDVGIRTMNEGEEGELKGDKPE